MFDEMNQSVHAGVVTPSAKKYVSKRINSHKDDSTVIEELKQSMLVRYHTYC